MVEEISTSVPLQAYTIFCNAFRYQPVSGKSSRRDGLIPWQAHTFRDNQPNLHYNDETGVKSQNLHEDFNDYFYSSFANCLLGKTDSHPEELKQAYTLPLSQSITVGEHHLEIDYADFFLFPHGIGIVAFRIRFMEKTFDDISFLINAVRNNRLEQQIFSNPCLPFDVTEPLLNGNKQKAFTVIEHDFTFSGKYTRDHLLFDMATCSPVGSSIGEGKIPSLRPDTSYFESLHQENRVAVFDNWSALALFDTFTVLHKGSVYNYNWETKYFRFIYVSALFAKNYLIELNKRFHDPADHSTLDEEFYKFDRDFNFDQISHNFLPQVIYDKIRHSLNLELELEKLKKAIDRDAALKEKKRKHQEESNERRIKNALLVVAFLAVFSAVYDGSEWASAVLGGNRDIYYNTFSFLFFLGVILGVIYMLKKK